MLLLLGPQNKILDLIWFRNVPTDEQQIYQIFASRMFEARCRQEDAGKLKSFRHILYGKYATWVPPIYWTPHKDFPLPSSTAYRGGSKAPRSIEKLPLIPGQQLHGNLIPRPEGEWRRNIVESAKGKEASSLACEAANEARLLAETKYRDKSPSAVTSPIGTTPQSRRQSVFAEEGLEILDLYDAEAGFVHNVLKDSEDGSGTVSDNEDADVGGRFQFSSVHDFDSFDEDDEDSMIIPASAAPVRIPSSDRQDHQSMIELGFEMADSMDQAQDAMSAFESLAAKSPTSTASGANDASINPPNSLVRNEAWQPTLDLSDTHSRPLQQEQASPRIHPYASEGIPHAPTILDTENQDNDEELGFEVVENYD